MIRFKMHKTISFFILFSVCAYAADKGFVTGDVQTDEKLNKMLAIPEVKSFYEGCSKNKSAYPTPDKISECVWIQVQTNDSLKKKVLEIMKTPTAVADSGKPAGALPISENVATDPALQKLSDIIAKKLDEALFGTAASKDPNRIATVDQKKFNDIYRAELGKTMIDAFMSYCLETVGTKIQADTDFKSNRDQNIKDLKDNPVATLDAPKWAVCMGNVKNDCINSPANLEKIQQDRACLVTQYVEASRKNLTVLDATDISFKGMTGGIKEQNSVYQEQKIKTTALVTVTSKEIEEAYKDTTIAAEKDLKDCKDNGNEEKCKQFLNTKTDANTAGLVEFNLQKNVEEANFQEKVQAINKDNLKAFLLERGYKEDVIAKMNLDDIDAVKKAIKYRYSNEKEALIKEMNEKVSGKTSVDEGKTQAQNNISKLDKIQTELSTRTENMKNLVMFDNLVSGFLEGTVQGAKKNTHDRNTASLVAELDNNDTTKEIKTKIESSGTKLSTPDGEPEKNMTFDASNLLAPADNKQPTP